MIKFNFSSDNTTATSGVLKQNGFSSFTLSPVGSHYNFKDTLAKYLPTDAAFRSLPTTADVAADVAQVRNDIEDLIDTETNVLAHSIDNTVSLIEEYGTAASALGNAAMYSLDIINDGVITGYEMGSIYNPGQKHSSYFTINADTFMVGRSYDPNNPDEVALRDNADAPDFATMWVNEPNGDITPVPAFAIKAKDNINDGYDIMFNGRTVFHNLVDGEGETIIDGGHIKTNLLDADQIVISTNSTVKHLGKLSEDPILSSGSYTDTEDPHIFIDYILQTGDTYYNTTINTTKLWNGTEWTLLKGTGKFIKYIFKAFAIGSTPDAPVGGSYDGKVFIPPDEDWLENAVTPSYDSGTSLYVSYATVAIEEDDSYKLDTEWSVPNVFSSSAPIYGVDFNDGKDGSYTSYIYSVSDSKPSKPSGGSYYGNPSTESIPDGWTDNPTHGSTDIEWISTAVYRSTGTYWLRAVDWSDPTKFYQKGDTGAKGENGIDGTRGVVVLTVDVVISGDTVSSYRIGNGSWVDPGSRDNVDTSDDYYNFFSYLVSQRASDYGENGDNIRYNIYSSTGGTIIGTKEAIHDGSNWMVNVVAKFHGSVVVDDTLRASSLVADSISGLRIDSSTAHVIGNKYFYSSHDGLSAFALDAEYTGTDIPNGYSYAGGVGAITKCPGSSFGVAGAQHDTTSNLGGGVYGNSQVGNGAGYGFGVSGVSTHGIGVKGYSEDNNYGGYFHSKNNPYGLYAKGAYVDGNLKVTGTVDIPELETLKKKVHSWQVDLSGYDEGGSYISHETVGVDFANFAGHPDPYATIRVEKSVDSGEYLGHAIWKLFILILYMDTAAGTIRGSVSDLRYKEIDLRLLKDVCKSHTNIGMYTYNKDNYGDYDCDDFANALLGVFAQPNLAKYCIWTAGSPGHRFNIARCTDGHYYIIEPQNLESDEIYWIRRYDEWLADYNDDGADYPSKINYTVEQLIR